MTATSADVGPLTVTPQAATLASRSPYGGPRNGRAVAIGVHGGRAGQNGGQVDDGPPRFGL